jgi:hypothetical protein
MATEPIGFFPRQPTKRDLELVAQAKQAKQQTNTTNLVICFLGVATILLIVVIIMQMRRIPLAS